MYGIPDLPFAEQKRWAITRRVSIFIEWLKWDTYAIYEEHPASTKRLTELMEIVNDGLGAGIPAYDWEPFHRRMVAMRKLVRTIEKQEGDRIKEEAIYNENILMLKSILEEYRGCIEQYNFSDI